MIATAVTITSLDERRWGFANPINGEPFGMMKKCGAYDGTYLSIGHAWISV